MTDTPTPTDEAVLKGLLFGVYPQLTAGIAAEKAANLEAERSVKVAELNDALGARARKHGDQAPILWCIVCQRWILEDEWPRDRLAPIAQEGHKDMHAPTVDLGNTAVRIAEALGINIAGANVKPT